MGRGIWFDGVTSEEEIKLLQRLLRVAVTRARMGSLPYVYEDNKISFKAWLAGNVLHTFYGWKFPPKKMWSREVKRPEEECPKCLPEGPDGTAAREVWCCKIDYNERRCPYGVITG